MAKKPLTFAQTPDADKLAIVTEVLDSLTRVERSQSAAGHKRQWPRYERAVVKLLTLMLDRAPTEQELLQVLS